MLTELLNNTKLLPKNESNLMPILNGSKENILIVSSKTKKILSANKPALKYLGYNKSEIRDINLCDIISKEYPAVNLNESNQKSSISIELCRFIAKPGYSFLAEKKSENFNYQNGDAQIIFFREISKISNTSENKDNTDNKLMPIYDAINQIGQKIGCVTHDMFLKNMTYHLSGLLKVKWAMVCKIIQPDCNKAEMMMLWDKEKFQKDIVYSIKGTPCELTYKAKEPYVCDKNLLSLFSKDTMAHEMGVDSYVGVPIISSEKKVIGMLAIMDNKPIRGLEKLKAKVVLQEMGIRCSQEIQRNQYNDKNKQRQNFKKYLKVLPDQKPLSLREKEVVGYVIKGLADSNIAHKLSISIPTVKFHLKNIYRKLGINNRKGFLKIYCID